jgi:hypothetical protein
MVADAGVALGRQQVARRRCEELHDRVLLLNIHRRFCITLRG